MGKGTKATATKVKRKPKQRSDSSLNLLWLDHDCQRLLYSLSRSRWLPMPKNIVLIRELQAYASILNDSSVPTSAPEPSSLLLQLRKSTTLLPITSPG